MDLGCSALLLGFSRGRSARLLLLLLRCCRASSSLLVDACSSSSSSSLSTALRFDCLCALLFPSLPSAFSRLSFLSFLCFLSSRSVLSSLSSLLSLLSLRPFSVLLCFVLVLRLSCRSSASSLRALLRSVLTVLVTRKLSICLCPLSCTASFAFTFALRLLRLALESGVSEDDWRLLLRGVEDEEEEEEEAGLAEGAVLARPGRGFTVWKDSAVTGKELEGATAGWGSGLNEA